MIGNDIEKFKEKVREWHPKLTDENFNAVIEWQEREKYHIETEEWFNYYYLVCNDHRKLLEIEGFETLVQVTDFVPLVDPKGDLSKQVVLVEF